MELGALQGVQNDRDGHIISDGSWSWSSQTFRFRDIGKKLNAYMTQICKFIKYAIFCLYLTIKSVETVYEILYGAINTIWWLKERIEGS